MEKTIHPKDARIKAGIRQVDLASKAGIALMTVIRCEKHGRWPRGLNDRAAYLKAVNLTEADIVSDEGPKV